MESVKWTAPPKYPPPPKKKSSKQTAENGTDKNVKRVVILKSRLLVLHRWSFVLHRCLWFRKYGCLFKLVWYFSMFLRISNSFCITVFYTLSSTHSPWLYDFYFVFSKRILYILLNFGYTSWILYTVKDFKLAKCNLNINGSKP